MTIEKMKIGEVIKVGPLLKGLTPTDVMAQVSKITANHMEFKLMYLGVSMGTVVYDLKSKTWKESM